MHNNRINGVKFTQTEIKILSCFACYVTKSKLIGAILGSAPKTIDTHTDNIKRKINVNSKDEILFFIKNSDQFNHLKLFFNQQHISYKYLKAAKTIAHKLKPLNAICNLNVSPELDKDIVTNEISQSITLAGIKINTIDNLPSLSDLAANLSKEQFYLFIVQNVDEIEYLQKHTNNGDHGIIYVCLGESPNQTVSFKKHNVLFYNKNNPKEFYHFFINHLIKFYDIVNKLNESLDFLSSIDNIEHDIQPEIRTNDVGVLSSNNQNNQSILYSVFANKYAIFLVALACVGIIAIIWSIKASKQTIIPAMNVGISNLNRQKPSDVLAYNLPPLNTKFTGRQKALAIINDELNKRNMGVITQAIVGAGGIGKTQFAAEYAYRAIESKEYDAVLWIPAQTSEKIDEAYIELANKLKIDIENLSLIAIQKVVHSELLETYKVKKILFILDNVHQEQNVALYFAALRNQWPSDIKAHVLITSRSQHWTNAPLILDVFTPKEARAFIKQHLPYEQEEDVIKLTELLHHYPLALGQAVEHIKQHTNIADYMELYTNKKQQYLNVFSGHTSEYKETIWSTLSISLSKLSDHAKEILYISSYFGPDNIQLEFFNHLSVEQRANAIKELRKQSFIVMANNGQSFKVHTLIQEIIRLMIRKKPLWLDKAIMLASEGASSFNIENKITYNNARNWLFHVTTISQYMPQTLETADLLYKYGNLAQHFGLYHLGHELFLNSLHIKELLYKNINHIQLTDTLSKLGSVELTLAHYDKAKKLYNDVLKIKETYYNNTSHIQLAEVLNDIASVELQQGYYEKAKTLYIRALDIQENYYQSSTHIKLIDTLQGLGRTERYLGRFNEAKKIFENTLHIKEAHYKNLDHVDLAKTLDGLGLMEIRLGNYKKAKKLHERALELYKRHYRGLNTILTVGSLHNLALTEWQLGNYETSKNLYNEVLKIKQDHYQTPNHIAFSITLQGLGLVEFSIGNYAEAKNLLELDVKIRKNHYKNPNHVSLADSLCSLGLIEEALCNYDVALSHLYKSYQISHEYHKDLLHKVLEHDYSPVMPWPKLNNKNKDKAIDYYRQNLEIVKKLFGKNHHFVARSYYLLGQAYEINMQPKQARIQYEQALVTSQKVYHTINDDNVRAAHQKNIKLIENKLQLA